MVGAPDAILVRNVRWLAGYRHPRHDLPAVAATLRQVFAEPGGLLDDALALDLRKPQDYFHRVWSTAFRAHDLAEAADDQQQTERIDTSTADSGDPEQEIA